MSLLQSVAAAAAATEPSPSNAMDYGPDVPGISDRRRGQLLCMIPLLYYGINFGIWPYSAFGSYQLSISKDLKMKRINHQIYDIEKMMGQRSDSCIALG